MCSNQTPKDVPSITDSQIVMESFTQVISSRLLIMNIYEKYRSSSDKPVNDIIKDAIFKDY